MVRMQFFSLENEGFLGYPGAHGPHGPQGLSILFFSSAPINGPWYHFQLFLNDCQAEVNQDGPGSYADQKFQLLMQYGNNQPTNQQTPFNPFRGGRKKT